MSALDDISAAFKKAAEEMTKVMEQAIRVEHAILWEDGAVQTLSDPAEAEPIIYAYRLAKKGKAVTRTVMTTPWVDVDG